MLVFGAVCVSIANVIYQYVIFGKYSKKLNWSHFVDIGISVVALIVIGLRFLYLKNFKESVMVKYKENVNKIIGNNREFFESFGINVKQEMNFIFSFKITITFSNEKAGNGYNINPNEIANGSPLFNYNNDVSSLNLNNNYKQVAIQPSNHPNQEL